MSTSGPTHPSARPVVLVPTYQERDNLDLVLDAIFEAQPTVHVCIVDDNSPDGTGALADARAAADPRVHVLHRPRKEGLGPAYLDGFRWALAHPHAYTHVFEMDADLSHDPRYLGPMLERAQQDADVVVGSRWVPGGGIDGWSAWRMAISRGGSMYSRQVLGVGLRDLTAGFLCYRRRVLETLPLHAVRSRGYGFQIEMKYRALVAGFTVVEHPIVFPDRVRGQSKMSMRIFLEGATAVWMLRRALPRPPR
ncbi:MAG: polyprenol monophosphomannose synthase [Deltaproteobacteria bacterium]|nr:polyprenol monophosphomannose synthase [Deltaproteobacteria bacterium]